MLTSSGPTSAQTNSPLKNPLLYSSVALGIALLTVGWIFYSRWEENRLIERKSREEKAQKQLENDRIALEQLARKHLPIHTFYAIPPPIHPATTLPLCSRPP